ncbi:MAG: hypothetical protein SGCHY_005236 [Lobulomycetales sp.]
MQAKVFVYGALMLVWASVVQCFPAVDSSSELADLVQARSNWTLQTGGNSADTIRWMADSYFGLSERMRFVKEFHLSLKEITALSEYSDLNRVSADLVTALGKLPCANAQVRQLNKPPLPESVLADVAAVSATPIGFDEVWITPAKSDDIHSDEAEVVFLSTLSAGFTVVGRSEYAGKTFYFLVEE